MINVPAAVEFILYAVLVFLAGGSIVLTLDALNRTDVLLHMIIRVAVGLLLLASALGGIILLSYNS